MSLEQLPPRTITTKISESQTTQKPLASSKPKTGHPKLTMAFYSQWRPTYVLTNHTIQELWFIQSICKPPCLEQLLHPIKSLSHYDPHHLWFVLIQIYVKGRWCSLSTLVSFSNIYWLSYNITEIVLLNTHNPEQPLSSQQ